MCISHGFFVNFVSVNDVRVTIYSRRDVLPPLLGNNFFHSAAAFEIIAKSRGQRPFMAVATDGEGTELGHLLAFVHVHTLWLPPFRYAQGRAYGEGVYRDEASREAVFGLLLQALTRKLSRRLCFSIEFSDLSRKMFGYRLFRENGYFPIAWMEVYNSLHSMPPRDRLSPKMLSRIERLEGMGVATHEAADARELHQFYGLLNGFYRFKMRRVIPSEQQLSQLVAGDHARVFVTTYHGRIIGGSVCLLSEGNAYLWYLASRRKRYVHLHPAMMTIWHVICWAWSHQYAHIRFLDVGLPVPHSPFRDFILSFGGKPVSTYRWFRLMPCWLNAICSWIYRE